MEDSDVHGAAVDLKGGGESNLKEGRATGGVSGGVRVDTNKELFGGV